MLAYSREIATPPIGVSAPALREGAFIASARGFLGAGHAASASSWAAQLAGAATKSRNCSGSASSRACAPGVRDMPFSRNNRASVAFLLPTKDTACQPESGPGTTPEGRGGPFRRWMIHCCLSYARRQRPSASRLNSGLSAMVSGRLYRLVEAYPVTRNAVSVRRITSWR